jgi:hypothetical protein
MFANRDWSIPIRFPSNPSLPFSLENPLLRSSSDNLLQPKKNAEDEEIVTDMINL